MISHGLQAAISTLWRTVATGGAWILGTQILGVVSDRIRKVSLKGTTRKSDKPERFLRIDRLGAQL